MGQEPKPPREETISLEFYDLTTDEIRFTVDLTQEDFERYQLLAHNMGVPFEEFIANIAEAQLHEENTDWFIPMVNEDGDVEPDRSRPFILPTLEEIAGEGVADDGAH